MVANYDGPASSNSAFIGTVSPADLNGDGRFEILVGSTEGSVSALAATDGTLHWRFRTTANRFDGKPLIADLDGDGALEVLLADQDPRIYVLDGPSGTLETWFDRSDGAQHGVPAIADVDGDGRLEVVVADPGIRGLLVLELLAPVTTPARMPWVEFGGWAWSRTRQLDPWEPNEVTATAADLLDLDRYGAVPGYIQHQADVDHYRIRVTQTVTLSAELTDLPPGTDYELALLDGVGNLLATSTNGGSTPERIDRGVTPGAYYLRVWSAAGYDGARPYALWVQLSP